MNRKQGSLRSLFAAVSGLYLALAAASAAGQPSLVEYTVESAFIGNGTKGIAVGPDGQVWFVNPNAAHALGKIATAGLGSNGCQANHPADPQIDLAVGCLPNPVFDPAKAPTVQTATGPIISVGGDTWIAYSQTLVQYDPAGPVGSQAVNHYFPDAHPSPTPSPFHQIGSMAWDGANSIWFADSVNGSSKISRYDIASGMVQASDPPAGCAGFGGDMARAPDGSLWYSGNSSACRIHPDGTITAVPVPLSTSDGIAVGPDGRIWVSSYTGSAHLQAFDWHTCQAASCVTVYDLPNPAHHLHGLTAGPDGRIWFVGENPDMVGSVKTDGTDFQSILLKDSQGNSPTTSRNPRRIVAGPPGDNSVWFTESITNVIGRVTGLASSTTLVLQGGRFKLEIAWAVPPQGTSGVGTAIPIAPDTGAFWFFSPNNLEMMVKVLGPVNGHWWVFFGSLTNVEFDLTVTDVATGAVKPYHNPYGTQASVADTSAFSTVSPPPEQARSSVHEVQGAIAGFDPADLVRAELASGGGLSAAAQTPCAPDATTLCLTDSRFKVQVAWHVPSQGTSGVGTASALTGDTGTFWFFSSNNLELIIKVLDARVINNHFWVFYGALSNVEYTITITDTQTGTVRIYHNPDQNLASFSDTSAF